MPPTMLPPDRRGHNCGHDTCSIHRTGDSLIIVCEHCGHRAVYPLDGGEPFEPKPRVRIDWAVVLIIVGSVIAASLSVLWFAC